MDDYFEREQTVKYRGLRDYHLRSALTSTNLTSKNVESQTRRMREEVKLFEENYNICERDPCKILGKILKSSIIYPVYGYEFYSAGNCLKIESKMNRSLPAPLLQEAGESLLNEKILTKYYVPSTFLQQSLIASNAMNAEKDLPPYIIQSNTDIRFGIASKKLSGTDITIKISSECFGILMDDNKLSIHHIDHLKNWSDKCTERFNIELACIFGHSLNPTIYPPIELIYDFWIIWDRELQDIGNEMYKCVKLFESLVIGTILTKNPNENITPLSDFLTTTVTDFVKSNNKENMIRSINIMTKFLSEINSMQYLSQLYGLYRTWGHPIVDQKSGIEKVYKLGTTQKSVSKLIPIMIRRVFMIKYFCWFRSKKGIYPEIYVDNENENSITHLLSQDCSTFTLLDTKLSADWDRIRFKKNINVPKTYNLSEMVADKAISPDRDGLSKLIKSGSGFYDANLRRGVLQWLTRDAESCEEFLNKVNNSSLDKNELVIGLYQKEREVNQTPRMFALMSHAIRNYIVTTESMLSEDILPAFPEITMTDNMLSLQKKIYAVSHQQASNSEVITSRLYKDITIVVNIDFEKWNLNFRKETTFPIFEAIGDLYGMEHLYNRTYDIFQNSLIYLADGSYHLKLDYDNEIILEPPFSYSNHIGGFEGLRQKGWTLFTACGLELICSRHKCSYNIMGQGDNQVLALTWKTYSLDENRKITKEGKEYLTKKFHLFMNDLIQTFGELGLPIKALETWTSENLFLYGKFPTLRGVPLSMSLKKICRAYYLANEEIMTLDCSLATIQSNAIAACMSDTTSFVPYVIYKIQTLLALKAYSEYHVLLGKGAFDHYSGDYWKFTTSTGTMQSYQLIQPNNRWKLLSLLSWYPKILGGLSVIGWYDFLMRGFPDKVSSSLKWIKDLINIVTDNDLRVPLQRIYQCHINPEKNFILLVEDPCALNLVVPVDARSSIKQYVQEMFENLHGVKNKEFAQLFKFNNTWDKLTFCNALCEGDILHPRFIHDIAAATLGGYVDSIVSKVSKASTINKISLRASTRNPGRKIEKHEENYMIYLMWKMSKSNRYQSLIEHDCPTMQARELRLRSWDKILEGVTVPHPLSFLVFKNCSGSKAEYDTCDMNYISVSIPEKFCSGDLSDLNTLGSAPPYLGSETKEKVGSDPTRQVFGSEPLIRRPLRLLRVVNWFVPYDSHAKTLISTLLNAVCDLDPNEYITKEMGVTGSEAHRYRDQALKHGVMLTNMYTLGSHMHISTDPWKKYTRGAENFTINYQAILCTLQALVGGHLFKCYHDKIIPPREYHFHESCMDCIVPLTDEFHDFANEKVITLVPSGRHNQYLWVDEADIILKYRNDPLLKIQIPEMTLTEYLCRTNKREILTSWISNDILLDLSIDKIPNQTVRLLDSKDYPRVLYKKLGVKELWEEVALELISQAGIKYSSGQGMRLAYHLTARELASDDIMKCSLGSFMGLAMFYTWPEKFSEIYNYDNTSIFPDKNPPSLSSCCAASQANMRDIIKRVNISAKDDLVISRMSQNPLSIIKRYWYRIFLSETEGCPQCLKVICEYNEDIPIVIYKATKCKLGHLTLTKHMLNIKILTASEDRLLKDSVAYKDEPKIPRGLRIEDLPTCPAIVRLYASENYDNRLVPSILELKIKKNNTWTYSKTLPTISKCRTLEILSVLVHELKITFPSNGVIFGDGLGDSSRLLSQYYPETKWIAASLQESELAIPQSYPHVLIPQNPAPSENIDYNATKSRYNDVLSDKFSEQWSEWVSGGICWSEIELKDHVLPMIINLVSLSKWEYLIMKSDFLNVKEMFHCINYLQSHSRKTYVYQTGSMNVESLEIVIISVHTRKEICNQPTLNSYNALGEILNNSSNELSHLSSSMIYSEYLLKLEDLSEITNMIRRCDHWFSIVGLTHFLTCTKLFTPIWWDLQTGKIPEYIKSLGGNKTYYMYKSDLIALQARLICLSLSLIRNSNELNEEINKLTMWKFKISFVNGKLDFKISRSKNHVDYGADKSRIIKLIPLLRKINSYHNRWWNSCPKTITFSTNKKIAALWISNLSLTNPCSLPELK
ncbi:TPA_asm: L [Epipactis gammacytorhabdovirus 1]|nr:TPA_asm: L [Epipactis gammacytorhabdovirus 1]